MISVTVPTVAPTGDPQFNRQQDQTNASRISMGGGGVRANNYLLDGVPITELRGRAVLNPTIEALEEVKVQVHTYDAEMGRTGGGVFNVTAKSGTNEFHGSGFYQTRPVWGVNENFFVGQDRPVERRERAGRTPTTASTAAAFGGPIWKNRTFFWTATEGYRSNTTRNEQQVWPSARQRAGDFSASTIGGVPVRIFNPYCRDRCRQRQVSGDRYRFARHRRRIHRRHHSAHPPRGQRRRLRAAWRLAHADHRRCDCGQREQRAQRQRDRSRLSTPPTCSRSRREHKFSDTWSMSGLYIYNKTDEPGSTIMRPEEWYIASQDNFFGPLRRRPHVAVINNTNILNDTTVVTLRYGFSTWQDSCDKQPFSAGIGSLGFSLELCQRRGGERTCFRT